MRTITDKRPVRRRIDLRLCVWPLLALALTPTGKGIPPIDPLAAPDYSFDLASCTVDGGVVEAGDVLNLDFPYPDVLLPGATLGLLSEEDDLDTLSAANPFVASDATFVLLFSVSAQTVGVAPPDPILIGLGVPYNVTDQAARGQAPGDQFMSTQLFTRSGIAGGLMCNNVLVRNNYDEGGTDFAAQPPTSAYQYAGNDPVDVVDATAWLTRLQGDVVDLYFSATAGSPSLLTLPHWDNPSGADIFFNENPPAYVPTMMYAAHQQLQLDQADDIDALVVFDTNQSGQFDGSDQVLFSLTPGSPSLDTIPGASAVGAAADVFVVAPGQMPVVFAAAADLGLGDPQDDINALDFLLCEDALSCAAQHGIRSLLGDLDRDGDVDLADLAQLLNNYGQPSGMTYEDGDIEPPGGDGDVDLSDLATLLANYGATCR